MINLNIDIDTAAIKKIADNIRQQIEDKNKIISKEIAENVFEESQRRVPVGLTEELKNSGSVEEVDYGYVVVYTAPHAPIVHEQPQSMRKSGDARYLASSAEDLASEGKIAEIIREGLKK